MLGNIAVLMTCYNRKDTTVKCLRALDKACSLASGINLDIYLVDDGSTDGTADAISIEFPRVNIITGGGNLFWNRGMLTAWRQASKINYDFYLWLNDDTMVYESSLTTLLYDSKTCNDEAITVGICESKSKDTITYSGMMLTDKKRIIPKGQPVRCDYFNGNVVLIPRSVFEKIGYLDSKFHHGLGDFEYGLRLKKAKLNAFVTSTVVACCDRHDSLPKWCNPNVNIQDRLRHFLSPLGGVPFQVFFLERKYFGLPKAIFHFLTIHLRLLFPTIWVRLGKAQI